MIHVNRAASTPLYLQIKKQFTELILSGTLPPGYKLPPERKLAEMLGVNRSTVLNAYRELKADGYVDSHIGQGTQVSTSQSDMSKMEMEPFPLSWKHLYSRTAILSDSNVTQDLLEIANRPDIISFAAGVAIPELNPLHDLQEIQTRLISDYGHHIFQHAPTEGLGSLRESIRQTIKARGILCSSEEIMVLSGSQQGIDFAARIFLNPGDVVFVEEPTYFCARQIFESAGASVIGIPLDSNGLRTDILEGLLKRYRPKFIYTIPTFHNPTGAVMDITRRRRLLSLAYRHQVMILEDDAYGELRYDGENLPPLKALDPYGYVIYLSTFSKVLFMGLRVGWMVAPKAVIQQFIKLKQISDLHTSSLPQWIIDRFIFEGHYQAHIHKAIEENRKRRDIMLEALKEYERKELDLKWSVPKGGLYIWCRLPEHIDASKLLNRSIQKGVAFVPGCTFYSECRERNCFRLNFTFPSPSRIRTGIKGLIEALEEVNKETLEHSKAQIEIKPIM